ncbi:MAG: helix-turn-helix domain-containing protein [Cyclobacteriaceae bacterium]|nr:helix-turn-helix domain-containing protein [Cyclobacteriaceae bacterium]
MNAGISEDQIIKVALRKILQDDFTEIKEELRLLRQEVTDLINNTRQNELLTMDELCAVLKLSRPSVNKLIHEKKKIKPVQLLDQDFRFKRSDVDEMIRNSYKEV